MDGLVTQGASPRTGGHGLREYRLLVYPDATVYNKLMAVKQRFFINYGIEKTVNTVPHIMVAGFYASEGMEETLIRWIQRICSRFNSFPVNLNNYSGIPTHSIYLRIQNPQPFKQLTRELQVIDDYVRSSSGRSARLIQPYLSIASELPEQVFLKAMPVYSRKTFHARFTAHELVLLAKDHPFASSKTVTVFRFLPACAEASAGKPASGQASVSKSASGEASAGRSANIKVA